MQLGNERMSLQCLIKHCNVLDDPNPTRHQVLESEIYMKNDQISATEK